MNIEHFDLLSWFHERHGTPAHKTMRKIAGRWSQCEVSVRRSCHGLDVLDGFILPVWCGLEALEPLAPRNGHLARHRPVAGVLLDERVSGVNSSTKTFRSSRPEADLRRLASVCEWLAEKHSNRFLKPHAKTRVNRARIQLNDECCAFRVALCNAPRPFS